MKTTKSVNWLVLFQPRGEITVATMRVIDAWSTTNGTRADAIRTMKANTQAYRTQFGDGFTQLVSANDHFYL